MAHTYHCIHQLQFISERLPLLFLLLLRWLKVNMYDVACYHAWQPVQSLKKTSKSIYSLVNSIQCDGHSYFFPLWKYVGTFHVKFVISFVHRRDLELNTANCWSFSVKSMPPPPCFWPSSSMCDVFNEN